MSVMWRLSRLRCPAFNSIRVETEALESALGFRAGVPAEDGGAIDEQRFADDNL